MAWQGRCPAAVLTVKWSALTSQNLPAAYQTSHAKCCAGNLLIASCTCTQLALKLSQLSRACTSLNSRVACPSCCCKSHWLLMMQALLTSRPDATLLPEPAVVTFTGYEVNCRHEQAVRFRNLSNLGKRIRSEALHSPTCSVWHQNAPTTAFIT